MTRALYRWLVALHPPAFSAKFADEMLWIFDEASESQSDLWLILDALRSVLRQWLFRPVSWGIVAGATAGLIEACLLLTPAYHRTPPHQPPAALAAQFNGQWQGDLEWPGPFGQMNLTLAQLPEKPSGDIQLRFENGDVRHGRIGDILIEGESLSFLAHIGDADFTFSGRLVHGKTGSRLTGRLLPAETAPDTHL